MGAKESAWERIKGSAPLSILIAPETEDSLFVEGLLRDLSSQLDEAGFTRVRFSCKKPTSPMEFWTALYREIRSGCLSLVDESIREDVEQQDADVDNALEAAEVYPCIESILDILSTDDRKILLLLEDFEAIFEWMDLPSINSFHSLTNYAALVTVSSTYPDDLGEQHFNNVYFLNQFLTVSFVEES